MSRDNVYIHPSAEVHPEAEIGAGTKIWNWTKIRENARIGANCTIGQCIYVDSGVVIGDACKIQNCVSVYHGVTIGRAVLVGPNVTFTNDRFPRAANPEWQVDPTVVEDGASIGGNATIRCGVRLGAYCMIGAGSVVTHDVPAFGLVVGQPARLIDYVDRDGHRLHHDLSQPPPRALIERG